MEKVAVVRHGDYSGEELNDTGKFQARKLGGLLEELSVHRSLVLTSTAKRASQTAAIIARYLGSEIEEHELLWSDAMHKENLQAAYDLIHTNVEKTDLLVIVTHLEYGERLPYFLVDKDWDKKPLSIRSLQRGQGVILDYQLQQVSYI
jgi:phosphohistidine phosphatase SixA